MYDILELSKKLLPELREIGKELKIKRVESFKKQDLIYKILDIQAIQNAGAKPASEEARPRPTIIKREKAPRLSKVEPSELGNAPKKKRGRKPKQSSNDKTPNTPAGHQQPPKKEIPEPQKVQVVQPPKTEQRQLSRRDQLRAIIQEFSKDKPGDTGT
jgi:transcription termination factor Rho